MLLDQLEDIGEQFRVLCEQHGVMYETSVLQDLLASALSSQLVLFAGPSGTGKSTAARMLSTFFTPKDKSCRLDVRPLWTGQENLTGFYSGLTDEYTLTEGIERLLSVASSGSSGVPFIVLEEANLSPMEVYMGNVLTALSSLAAEDVRWRLHWEGTDPNPRGFTIPGELLMTDYPRFLATINVDSTADAPSAKVCGRGLVVLLEPPSTGLAIASSDAIAGIPPELSYQAEGAGIIADPREAWWAFVANGTQAVLTEALAGLCTKLEADLGTNYVSPRDVQRCLVFMAWHVGLKFHYDAFSTETAAADDAAELALMQAVLPGLGSGQFSSAAKSLRSNAAAGGMLAQRLDRVLSSTKGIYGVPPDFWVSLA